MISDSCLFDTLPKGTLFPSCVALLGMHKIVQLLVLYWPVQGVRGPEDEQTRSDGKAGS